MKADTVTISITNIDDGRMVAVVFLDKKGHPTYCIGDRWFKDETVIKVDTKIPEPPKESEG
jgi:hypothetical protein